MKKLLLFMLALFISATTYAQTREFNYKALITNNGNALNNQAVILKFSIKRNGTLTIYSETQSTTTDVNGIVVEQIGDGTVLSGNFATIDWGGARYFLKVEIDINDGNGFQDFGTSELKAVPYAKYADKAANVFSGDFGDLSNVPTGLADGDDDTQLTDVQITAMGYIKDANDADHSTTNELQTLTFDNASRMLTITNGNSVNIPAGGSTGGDGWGTQVAATDGSINGDGASGSPLGVNTSDAVFNGWDKNASDDFDGDFSHLTNVPTGLADGDDDTQLTETQVDNYVANNGYLTGEVDGSTTNELQTILKTGSTVTLSNGGGSFTDSDTQLTETQVDSYTDDNGYAKSIDDLSDGKASGTAIFLGSYAGDVNTGNKNLGFGFRALVMNESGSNNIALGYAAMHDNVSGINNVAIGTDALKSNVANFNSVAIGNSAMQYANSSASGTPVSNVAVGMDALRGSTTPANNTGYNNTALGAYAMKNNTSGKRNVALGYFSLNKNTSGGSNTVLGAHAGANNETGSSNVFIGYMAGLHSTGNGNVFIGNNAGKDEVGNNKLYIHNSGNSTPLIGGDFYTREVTINGTLQVTGGTPGMGKVFTSDANGKGSWQTPADQTDADFYVVGTTDTPSSITDHIFHNGALTLGTDNATVGEFAKLKIFNGENEAVYINAAGGAGSANGIYLEASGVYATGIENSISGNGAGMKIGAVNSLETTGTGKQLGTYNILRGDASGTQYATYDTIYNSSNAHHYGRYSVLSGTGSGWHIGALNKLTGTGTGVQVGTHNQIDNNNDMPQIGLYNTLEGDGDGNHAGVFNGISGDGDGKKFGISSEISGSGTGEKYGSYNKISLSSGGKHYAVYGEAEKAGADVYAGYFKGDVKTTENIDIEGKVTAPESGNSDMKAYIYGQINEGASGPQLGSESSAGFTITEVSAGTYRINFGTSISGSKYLIVASLYNSTGFITYSTKSTTSFLIKTYNTAGSLTDKSFSFVVYKK